MTDSSDWGDLMLIDREKGLYETEDGRIVQMQIIGDSIMGVMLMTDTADEADEHDCEMDFVAAIDFHLHDGKVKRTVGLISKDDHRIEVEETESSTSKESECRHTITPTSIPASDWAVFTVVYDTGKDSMSHAYMRILTEWFPQSQYVRDESKPHLEKHII